MVIDADGLKLSPADFWSAQHSEISRILSKSEGAVRNWFTALYWIYENNCFDMEMEEK